MSETTSFNPAIPPHLQPQDGELVMFENPLLERLSRIRPGTVLAVFVPVVIFCLLWSLRVGASIPATAGLLVAGALFWSLFEYLMHRFVFHFFPRTTWQKKFQFTMHGVHHQYPNDKDRLVMPITVSIPLAALLGWLFHIFMGPWFWGFFAGFISGYLVYDMMHYAIHHWQNMKSPFMRRIRRHHMAHHFRDTNKGFGVSSPAWDRVFRT